ncbi:MAG: hypothetical protein QXE90_01835 [Candidatus Micrarchaeia archaeon]
MVNNLRTSLNSKNTRFFLAFLILTFASVFLFGCIKKIEPIDQYIKKDQIEYLQQVHPSFNNCTVMVCEYSSWWIKVWSSVKGYFSKETASLAGKECTFQQFNLDNEEDLKRLNSLTGLTRILETTSQPGSRSSQTDSSSSSSKFIQPVMIGIGDSVYAGDEIFSSCNGHLGINLIDVSSIPKEIESDSVKKRFTDMNDCILNSGTIPFYKFGRLESSLSSFAKKIDGEGPVFVSPGYGFNKSKFDPNIISPIGSFYSINTSCKNCIVTSTINYGDLDTLDYYKSYPLDWESIDVIAFTADLNSFDTCDPLITIQNETNSIKSFAQNITEKYHKPVIVIVQGNEGNNTKKTCEWTNESIARFYDYLIRSIPDLVSSGVIGIIAPDMSQLSSEMYNSIGFFCSIYYTPASSSFNFATYSIFSREGDKPSACGMYKSSTTMFMFGDVKNYSELPLQRIKRDETCNSKLFYGISVGPGTFFSSYCEKNNKFISNLASKYFIDSSLFMATLQKLGYYQSNQLQQYEKHCGSKCEVYSNQEQRDLCCLAETMAYYQNKTLNKKSNIDDMFLAYFIAYGTIKGESAYNQEFNKYSPSANMERKSESPILLLEPSSGNSKAVYMQSSFCDLYLTLCKEYQDVFYCMLYDQNCKYQTPTIPEQPSLPTPPTPPTEPQEPSQPQPYQPPSGSNQIPTYDFDGSILQVIKDAVAARITCGLN